ncbi:hypothetical protein RSSM_00293 [Rhodopirellula sallentina SM41]|uniref:Uncharacterized protein n=1 Tax=Rhodopirellula sallentina SM41 TaxID=1263870 RepID=M5UAE7_9BACT|nr:hypothetical protein RSSM_00293 [Rhodopirellula sallentina SM41]
MTSIETLDFQTADLGKTIVDDGGLGFEWLDIVNPFAHRRMLDNSRCVDARSLLGPPSAH